MSNFVVWVATPTVQQVAEKKFLRSPTVRLGPLYVTVGCWVFQQGGALGHLLQVQPVLLDKLLGSPAATGELIEDLKQVADHRNQGLEVFGWENTFTDVYTRLELIRQEIDLISWPPDKRLDKEVKQKEASEVIVLAFATGAALGYHFPDEFKSIWENTYATVPKGEWNQRRASGLVLSETQRKRPLEDAQRELAAEAYAWAVGEEPGRLTADELAVLQTAAA